MKKVFTLLMILMLATPMALAKGPQGGMAGTYNYPIDGTAELSEAEIDGLLLMREEEKLARDVYLTLYDKWNMQIFSNIASSEQTHTDAVKRLLDAYDIEDPVTSDGRGVYQNEDLEALYDALVEQGSTSLLDALIVGATVEDLDIKDLADLLAATDNNDLIQVYTNLQKGSRNHIRSFIKQIEAQGGSYEAQYISSAELSAILGGSQETGPLLTDESDINHTALGRMLQRGKSERGMNNYQNTMGKGLGVGGVIDDLKMMNSYTDSSLGQRVSSFASQYQSSYQRSLQYEQQMQQRSSVSRFFFGGDRQGAQQLQEQVQQQNRLIQDLEADLDEADESEATVVRQQLQQMKQEQNRLDALAKQEEQKKGLFRWW
ncbi:DUF2202 domain-containing protein [Candidatus Woesearchaeota archaeon]|nr:DUF2202 domain-containing protein [Candidatus Woesearchaeota archaeon]